MCTVILPPGDTPVAVNKYIVILRSVPVLDVVVTFLSSTVVLTPSVSFLYCATISFSERFKYGSCASCELVAEERSAFMVAPKLYERRVLCVWNL